MLRRINLPFNPRERNSYETLLSSCLFELSRENMQNMHAAVLLWLKTVSASS